MCASEGENDTSGLYWIPIKGKVPNIIADGFPPDPNPLLSVCLIRVPLNNMPARNPKQRSEGEKEPDRKKIAAEYFKLLAAGKMQDGLRFFAPDCKVHNPYISGGMAALTGSMISVSEKMSLDEPGEFTVEHVVGDGDMVAVHTQIRSSKPRIHGMRQVHLFRFKGDKIIEYWDITQMVPGDLPNASGAF